MTDALTIRRLRKLLSRAADLMEEAGSFDGHPLSGALRRRLLTFARSLRITLSK
jgi:hypothetical protein